MKKTGLLFLAFGLILFAFSGCSKDDEDKFDIVGTWNVDKVEIYVEGELMETIENDGTFTFNADGTGTVVDDEGTDTFEWSLSGDKLTITDDEGITEVTLTTMERNKMVGEFEETWEEITFKVVLTMTKL